MDSPLQSWQALNEGGYVVIRNPWLENNVPLLRDHFLHAARSFPEYARNEESRDHDIAGNHLRYVGGGFGALGNPASFHNPFVRLLREWCMAVVIPVFACAVPPGGTKLEQIIDRMMFRLANVQKATAETWHRDVAVGMAPGDRVFGGWINLDLKPQYFSGIGGSHVDHGAGVGFAPVQKAELAALKNHPNKVKVEIPPGAILVFYENMIHEVLGNKALKYDSYRLFLGWRLTASSHPVNGLDALRARLEEQAVMPLKSGQVPPMYPTLWWVNWFDKHLAPWSEVSFTDETKVLRARGGAMKHVVHRHMPSLRTMGLPLYPPYSPDELRMYTPSTYWALRAPGHHAPQPFALRRDIIVIDDDSRGDEDEE